MTEDQWLRCANPLDLLFCPLQKPGPRKLRLYACACCRLSWDQLTDDDSRRAVEVAERFADGLASVEELGAAHQAAWEVTQTKPDGLFLAAWGASACNPWVAAYDVSAFAAATSLCPTRTGDRFRAEAASLFRRLVGNPFRPARTPSCWSSTLLTLAAALYEGVDCAFALHDALTEAGLDQFAEHFRTTGRWHPKGCWVADLILGRA